MQRGAIRIPARPATTNVENAQRCAWGGAIHDHDHLYEQQMVGKILVHWRPDEQVSETLSCCLRVGSIETLGFGGEPTCAQKSSVSPILQFDRAQLTRQAESVSLHDRNAESDCRSVAPREPHFLPRLICPSSEWTAVLSTVGLPPLVRRVETPSVSLNLVR